MKYLKNDDRFLGHNIVAIPIMSILIVPIALLDFWVEVYHRVCFPIYKFPYVNRKNYIQIDRHKLEYLTLIQKIYCVYCGYTNGVLSYWVEIAGETESYWCGIRHKQNPNFVEPAHHENFAKYNDEADFDRKYKKRT